MDQLAVKAAGRRRARSGGSCWRSAAAILFLAGAGAMLAASRADPPPAGPAGSAGTGPTIRLDYAQVQTASNPVAAFMYFVPLISPEPVTVETSPGSTQAARVISARRQQSDRSFTTTCDFEFTGAGSEQNTIDLARQIKRHERRLKAGGTLGRQLHSITVTGAGCGRVEVEGTVTNGIQTVNEVRLRFNARGHTSPVAIELCDVRHLNGDYRLVNEMVARVNTLTFRRKAGPPKMEVTVASVKPKGAGNGLWQSLKGGLKGAAVNLLIDPLTVEAVGHRAILDFGQALVTGSTNFTFPRARNLTEKRP